MSTEHHIHQLLSAIQVLKELPVMKLAENRTLVREIQSIISGRNLSGLIDSMRQDYRIERDAAFNQQKKPSVDPESHEFLATYARYRGAAHNILKTGAESAWTSLATKENATAFNAKEAQPEYRDKLRKQIVELPETKAFAEAYNSIYSDHALQIGTSQDPTQLSSYLDYSPYIWNYRYYLSIPTLSQTIDLSINMATRQLPTIQCKDKGMKKAIDTVIKRGRFNEKVQKMLLYSHLSPRGSLLVPIIDDNETVRFNCFNDTQFTYATAYQYSRVDFRDNMAGVSELYVLGHLLQNEVTAHFLCPGFEPLYAIGKNRLYQLKDAAEAINIYLYTIKVLCIRAQVMKQTWGGEGQNDTLLARLKQTTDDINSKLSLNTAVRLPEGADLDILNNNFSEGFAKVSPIIKEFQGMLSGIMPDYLYGSNTAYAANTFNIHATHQNIRSQIQEAQIEPIYRFAINSYLKHDKRFKAWEGEVDEFDIDFESLYEATADEQETINAKKIDNIIKMGGYPELAPIFKQEGLLDDQHTLPELPKTEPPPHDTEPPEPEPQSE